jgi:hypothetical protein
MSAAVATISPLGAAQPRRVGGRPRREPLARCAAAARRSKPDEPMPSGTSTSSVTYRSYERPALPLPAASSARPRSE